LTSGTFPPAPLLGLLTVSPGRRATWFSIFFCCKDHSPRIRLHVPPWVAGRRSFSQDFLGKTLFFTFGALPASGGSPPPRSRPRWRWPFFSSSSVVFPLLVIAFPPPSCNYAFAGGRVRSTFTRPRRGRDHTRFPRSAGSSAFFWPAKFVLFFGPFCGKGSLVQQHGPE